MAAPTRPGGGRGRWDGEDEVRLDAAGIPGEAGPAGRAGGSGRRTSEDDVRRHDREITDRQAIDEILRAAQVCRIALCDGDRPYIVPMNFGLDGNRLYFHCASEGRKLDVIRRNPQAGFEVDIDHHLVRGESACHWGCGYRSVVGFGRIRRVDDPSEKLHGLQTVMRHYGGEGCRFSEDAVERVTVLCLEILEVTGKACRVTQTPE